MLAGVGAFNYAVDPFHYYRGVSAFNHRFLPGFQRLQNVGLARNFSYETVVIGSSVTENFLSSYVGRIWGGQAIKLSMSGATSYEQLLVLQQAIDTGQVRRVLWGLDAASFYGSPHRVRDEQQPFPYFMYRSRAIPNVEYLLSLSTLEHSLRVLQGSGETNLDELDTWYRQAQFGEAAVLKSWAGNCGLFGRKFDPARSELLPPTLHDMRESVARNLGTVIRTHPEIEFDLFFPPMATLIYVPVDIGLLPALLPFRRAVAQQVMELPNVRVFDFQASPELIDDLDRYKDPMHFDLRTAQQLIDAMRDGRNRANAEQLQADGEWLIGHVNHYTLCTGGRLPVG